MADYLGALDQGTTSTRFMIFDRSGRPAACSQKEHEQIYPRPGWVEHDPEEIWFRTQQVIEEAMAQMELRPKDLAALGITNQRETTVLWDRKTGRPVHNAVVWQDTRVGEMVAELAAAGGPDRFRAQTGLPLSTYFSSLKIRWLLENVSGVRERAEAGDILFGTMDSFLAWRLSGGLHVTDCTNASRTQLMNLESMDWDPELLHDFGIPRQILPEIRSSSEVYGQAGLDAVRGVPIAGILGDQQAALMGQACFGPGEAKNTYGTGCFLLMNTGRTIVPSRFGLLTTVAFRLGNQAPVYALEGSVAITGALVQWLRDNFGLIRQSGEIEALAGTRMPVVIFVTAYDEFALQAFEARALDYLLKPFGRERLATVLRRAQAVLSSPEVSLLSRARETLQHAGTLSRVFVRDGNRIVPIQLSSVERVQASDDYVTIHSVEKQFLITVRLSDLEERLVGRNFLRIHRSHLINLEYVTAIEPHDPARLQVVMKSGARIVACRAGSKRLRDLAL